MSRDRTCACGNAFTAALGDARVLCMLCVEKADERAKARLARRAEAERSRRRRSIRAGHCSKCKTRLLEPAELCGICEPSPYDKAVKAMRWEMAA